ncbi:MULTISPECIES: RidA family protein [unclassified Cupriavidus]|uniref:RidA family protein n=1 Tax=unclassified Cupriavidus TaxID=2640874 RepID=UPI0010F711DD|nr:MULTISPECIES: RidA family protein [unclassified Cupriavidus]MWL89007.1 RidA family protein [Cupriavidus sp. SW-Y-13]
MDGNHKQRDGAVRTIQPATMAAPGGHYSHATVANGMVFVSGQLPVTVDGHKLVDASFEAQAQQVLDNVKAALVAAGSGIEGLAQVRVYVDDIENWPAFNKVYAAWIGEARPARAVVPTGALHYGFKIEVEAVGVVL